jgi:hypothetical protein
MLTTMFDVTCVERRVPHRLSANSIHQEGLNPEPIFG